MDLKSLFQRFKPRASATSDDAVQIARARARRRLIGASVLLVVGVVTFPLLFETKPRPLPMDTPLVMAAKPGDKLASGIGSADASLASAAVAPSASTAASTAAPSTASPAASSAASPPRSPQAPDQGAPAASASFAAVPSGTVARPAPAPASAAPEVKSPVAASGAAVVPTQPEPAVAKPEPKKAEPKKAEPQPATKDQKAGRFVVQVGAFADAASTREARSKAEKLGLKTYTQDVDTANGKRTRVRVGPFTTREEAQKAAAKLRAANLPASVLTL